MAKSLNEALLALQKEVPHFQKNALNPHFNSKYVSLDSVLDEVLPLLHKHELLWRTKPTLYEGKSCLRYVMTHVPSGETDEDVMPLLLDRGTPQGQGSGITYGRRYALVAYLNLVIDRDDDGTQGEKEANLPVQTQDPLTPPTEDQENVLREMVTDLSSKLKKHPDEWAKVEAWAKERQIDLAKPPADKLRTIERSVRRKLDELG